MAAITRSVRQDRRAPRAAPATPWLLQLETPVAVKRVAVSLLNDLRRARRRLERTSEGPALHDFRVALRRLRTTLRAYKPWLTRPAIPRKLRRRLKRLARRTGAARDAEVALSWLRRERRDTSSRERTALACLVDHWNERCRAHSHEIQAWLPGDFDEIETRLRALLRRQKATGAPCLCTAAGRLLHEQILALSTALDRIASAADDNAIHRARIQAKRLRYLLEPLAREIPNGKVLVDALKKFQSEFGELCDRHVLSAELASAAARYASDRMIFELRHGLGGAGVKRAVPGGVMPGLAALAKRLNAERRRLFTAVERRYLGKRVEDFLAPYRTAAANVAECAGAKPTKDVKSIKRLPA